MDNIFFDILLSTLRWLMGLSLGVLFGLCLTGLSSIRTLGKGPAFVFDFLRAIPIIGLVPLVQMHCGIDETGKVGLIAWGVMFPVWLTLRGILERDLPSAELMLTAARIPNARIDRIVHVPKLLAGLISGIQLAIGIAWLCVVAAEWIGTYNKGFWAGGLGYRLIVSYQMNDWRQLYAALFCFGFLGTLTAYGWRLFTGAIFKRTFGFDPIRWLKRG